MSEHMPADGAAPRLSRWVGRRPQLGAAAAARRAAEDLGDLVRAEIALAKAEVADGLKSKAQGAALFVVAGVLAWLGLQGLLITLGFVLAVFMPGWVAALLVTLLLLGGAAVLVLIGRARLQAQVSLEQTKSNVATDIDSAKHALPRRDAEVRA